MNTLSTLNLLYESEDMDSTIIECIYNNLINKEKYPLTEASGLMDLTKYQVLIESVDEINDVEDEISKTKSEDDPEKKEMLLKRVVINLKKVWDWWYKVDPDKKFKTLHLILRIVFKVVGLILIIYAPGKGAIAKNVSARMPANLGYKGTKKVLKKIASKEAISMEIARTIYSQIIMVLKSLNNKAKFKANIKDIDKAIAEYDATIDKLNELIEQTGDPQIKMSLEKSKKDAETALATLIKMKENHDEE